MSWNHVNLAQPTIFRSTFQQTDQGLLYKIPTFVQSGVNTGLAFRRFELHNREGVARNVGIGFRYHNAYWRAGQWTDATTTYTDDTTDAQDVDADSADFQLTTTTANDGFVILCPVPFDWVSLRVITAEVIGVGATHAVRYSNFAGTGWTAVDANSIFTDQFTGAVAYAAGALEFVWTAPDNWGKVVSIGNIPAGYYALNVRATDAPDTTGGVASVIEIGSMIAVDSLADNGIYASDWSTYRSDIADAVVAYFSAAGAGNRVQCEVTTA